MNYAQTFEYEPQGIGFRWMVEFLLGAQFVVRKTEPNLRSDESVTLWRVIGEAPDGLTKAEWLDRAQIRIPAKRTLGNNAIVNMLNGGWIRLDGDRFSKVKQ